MPFDGVVAKCVVEELSEILPGSRVEKIFQPEPDEIFINIRAKNQNLKLLLSANASYPRIHLTASQKENPAAPPVFCMLLRKHLSGGRFTGVEFHDFERIITVSAESVNELGDLTQKKLVIEIMGRHSNIILLNHEDKILDSIKHVDSEISSVREVMPGRKYSLPPAQEKESPETLDIERLIESVSRSDKGVENFLLNSIKGFSPLLCREMCWRAGLDGRTPGEAISQDHLAQLKKAVQELLSGINASRFVPCIIFDNESMEKPLDFHCVELRQYMHIKHLPSISSVLDAFYSAKDKSERLRQKKSVLLKVLNNNIERCRKKNVLQQETLRAVADREKLKLYGELITANIYCIPGNAKKVSLLNYYSENEEYLEIPLDENLTPQENAQRYFKKYTKGKSTFAAASRQLEETAKELEYLESVLHLLENCTTIQEIDEVRQELIEQEYLASRKKGTARKNDKPSAPFHYRSTDGFDILVGKNNKQNDLLTLKQAASNDLWLHTRNIPGSHVIIKKYNRDIPDRTLLEAATLAAFHSKARLSSNVPVDYTAVKSVKKPNGAKPGMVIYENFKTVIVTPDEALIKSLKA